MDAAIIKDEAIQVANRIEQLTTSLDEKEEIQILSHPHMAFRCRKEVELLLLPS